MRLMLEDDFVISFYFQLQKYKLFLNYKKKLLFYDKNVVFLLHCLGEEKLKMKLKKRGAIAPR